MSRDLEEEIKVLEAQCSKYRRRADKYKRKAKKRQRLLEKQNLVIKDLDTMLIEDQVIKLEMLKEYESFMHQMTEASRSALHEVKDTATRVIESHIKNNNVLIERKLKGVRTANQKKAELRNTTKKYSSMYRLYVEHYQQNGNKKHICEQKAREKIADIVEEMIGKRPGKSLLYDIFPKEKIP